MFRKTTRAALTALCLAGCSGTPSDKPATPSETATPTVTPTPPAPAAAPVAPPAAPITITPDDQGVVHLSAADTMRYNATRIEVKAGEKFKVELKNLGAVPKEAMGHDFVLLKPGSDSNAFGAKSAAAKATDFIPPDASEMLTHSKLLGPGESDTIDIDALAAGSYPFLCSFPGHVALMHGELVAL